MTAKCRHRPNLEADTAPSTILKSRDVFWKILTKAGEHNLGI